MTEKTRLLPNSTCSYLHISYDKLMQMVRKGEIPHYRIGRRVFFTKETLDLWLDNLEKKSMQSGD